MNLLNWLRRPFASQAISPVMNDDHAQHFRDINDLLSALDKLKGNSDFKEGKHNQITSMLRHILNEIAEHFRREQELMECSGYSGKEAHLTEHSAIIKTFEHHFGEGVSDSVVIDKNSVIQIKDVMVLHIKSQDRKLNEFLSAARPVGKLGKIASIRK